LREAPKSASLSHGTILPDSHPRTAQPV
jgi:hypothetical protein